MSVQFERVDGPPPMNHPSGKGKYAAMLTWCDENPGQWVVVKQVNQSACTTFRRRGYEVALRNATNGRTADIYVRRPQ